jgi:hypothetical protein
MARALAMKSADGSQPGSMRPVRIGRRDGRYLFESR